MTPASSNLSEDAAGPVALPASALFLVSAAVIGLELALMRCLAVAGWHHFSYLVISTALLGFGASGTLLSLFGRALERNFGAWSVALTLAFAVSIIVSFRCSQALPLNPRYVLYDVRQAGLMAAYHLILFVPFLMGATLIGLTLIHFGERVHAMYCANLLGSGAGGLVMVLLMFVLPEVRLLHAARALALAAAVIWSIPAGPPSKLLRRLPPGLAVGLCAAVLALSAVLWPLSLRIDQYKGLAHLRRLESQSDAQHILTRHSPRARLDVYDSEFLHQTLFLSLTADSVPPAQLAILADGHPVGTVFKIRSADQAPVLDYAIMSVPYRLKERPSVLLLGETGGVNVWLARRYRASHVTAVQRNPQLVQVLTGPLADMGGGVLTLPDVEAVARDPRLFVEQAEARYDIIQLVRAEGMAAGVSNLLSLHEDFLLTREDLALCLRRLRQGGLLAVTRGVQAPPRDNIKILATLAEALESMGIRSPGDHIVQLRNYLGVMTMASPTPIEAETLARLVSICNELEFDLEWPPHPEVDLARPFHGILAKPPGEDYTYYHYAARQIFSPEREQFFRSWRYNVRPASDDSPYFYNFFRWKSLPAFIEAHGNLWLQRMELGYVVVVAALVEVVLVGAVLILLPLRWLRRRATAARGRLPTLVYFTLLGIAFMLLEMVLILKFTHFLGDPILSAAGMLSAFLIFSGLGSAMSRRLCGTPLRAIGAAAVGIAVLAIAGTLLLDGIFSLAASWPTAARFTLSIALVAPLAFMMGWPFPNGLSCVRRGSGPLVPLAWGVNGFASVAGPPTAVLLAVAGGFRAVMLLAAVLYGCAGLVAWRLPGARLEASSSRS